MNGGPGDIGKVPGILEKIPRVPGGLSLEARKIWKTLSAVLIQRGALTSGDLDTLRLASEALAAYENCLDLADRKGFTLKRSDGLPLANPVLREARAWSELSRKWLSSLGLTPAVRNSHFQDDLRIDLDELQEKVDSVQGDCDEVELNVRKLTIAVESMENLLASVSEGLMVVVSELLADSVNKENLAALVEFAPEVVE